MERSPNRDKYEVPLGILNLEALLDKHRVDRQPDAEEAKSTNRVTAGAPIPWTVACSNPLPDQQLINN